MSKEFDTVHIGQHTAILDALGLPVSIATLLHAYYRMSRRVFVVRGCYSPQSQQVKHGVLQGCPRSIESWQLASLSGTMQLDGMDCP